MTKVISNKLIYALNHDTKTACLVGDTFSSGDIIIPRSIIHNSIEFVITSIKKNSLKYSYRIESIQFASDSQVKTIEEDAFSPFLKIIIFPSSINELKKGWCIGTVSLNIVKIMPKNQHFKNYNDQLIVGKTDIKKEDFDVLVFVSRDVKTITIPSNIKIISSYAFSGSLISSISIPPSVIKICKHAFQYCDQLLNIQIPTNSNLHKIGKYAFKNTSITSIYIPSRMTHISEGAFSDCIQLQKVEFSQESYLQFIGKNAFYRTSISSILIPSHVTQIPIGAFSHCEKLNDIIFSLDSKLQIIDKYAFFNSSIKNISIPSNVSELKENWCAGTPKLVNISIMPNNQHYIYFDDRMILGKIDIKHNDYDDLIFVRRDATTIKIPSFIKRISPYSFSDSLIGDIFIPPQVTKICECAFSYCENLHHIEFLTNSKLQTIEKYAFSCSSIESISIPSNVSELKKGWCAGTAKLNCIKIMPNNPFFKNYNDQLIVGKADANNEVYDTLVFVSRDIETITIPLNIKIIAPYAFSMSNIESIFIPSNVTEIKKHAFSFCGQLQSVKIQHDSNLKIIGKKAFAETSIEKFFVPSKVTQICEGAFLRLNYISNF